MANALKECSLVSLLYYALICDGQQNTSSSDAITQQPGAATVTDVRTLQQYPASTDVEQGTSQQTTVLNSARSGNTVSDARTNYAVHSQPLSQSQSTQQQQQQQQYASNSQASANDAVSTTAVAALSAEHSHSSAFENKSADGSRPDAYEQQQQQQRQQQQQQRASPHAAVAVPVDTEQQQQQQQQCSSAAVASPVAAAAAVAVPYGHIVQPPQGALGQVTVCGQCGVSRGSAKDMHCRECGEYYCVHDVAVLAIRLLRRFVLRSPHSGLLV
jgi:hypothetical protein